MPRARAGSRRRARASAWIWSPWRWPAGHLLRGGGRWHRWKKGPLWQRGPRFGFRARRRRGAHGASLTCFVGGSAVLPFFGTEAFIFWCPPSSRRRAVQGFVPLVFLAYGLFVHRFPKLWCLWRHQMWHLASRGYRCVAPDLRGYGGTTVPPDPSSYTVLHIVGDLVALLDALHLHQVFLVVHDQGATVCWNMCLLRPDQVRAVVPSCPRGEVPTATITTSAGSRRSSRARCSHLCPRRRSLLPLSPVSILCPVQRGARSWLFSSLAMFSSPLAAFAFDLIWGDVRSMVDLVVHHPHHVFCSSVRIIWAFFCCDLLLLVLL
ncbi:uncharacterized protein LOC100835508 isoform X1 [Brachypodium distachyon]|uniref:uncharacterized protein LOC100835508 isoform X1 n=1 Tax=Brachypodium distachyon TaxID=15368 RepID=UPI000D0D54A0|nr:uncharacterized protein LOC100835508 isoform X1 [Brachypodium distachyon]|eukprot:XP_024312367.1 uncharacterized protein LOC100835508 isoform X1 [Brachypodium distachyon]